MKADYIVAEIGSTTTVLSAFSTDGSGKLAFLAQGESYTTVNENDVTIGIEKALNILKEQLEVKELTWDFFLATSSAAGGLKITVHGLVYDMTVKAAREAALGAGGVIQYVTAGKIREKNLKYIKKYNPRLILLAGGVDYGEMETVLHNAQLLSKLDIDVPIVYAGNVAAKDEINDIFEENGKKVIITENVYPRIDQLNVEPTKAIIRNVFAKNIVKGPGMEKIYSTIDKDVIPTPAAVMLTTELLAEKIKDVMVVDIGGATTDVDSYTSGDPEIQNMLISPEPLAKRTVEGDLGVFINAERVANYIGIDQLKQEFSESKELLRNVSPYPKNQDQERFISRLARYCFESSVRRHAGKIRRLFGPLGRVEVAEGKDLTAIKQVIGTGGVLTKSRYKLQIMKNLEILSRKYPDELLPRTDVKKGIDKNYIFAAIGVLSTVDRQAALDLLSNAIETID
ncbi:MAG: DNA mismatch repair protein MutL [Kosmotoga sp.]|nr:MAG: DNA mismatch repair protein MutL [Kosmotoga sp.]